MYAHGYATDDGDTYFAILFFEATFPMERERELCHTVQPRTIRLVNTVAASGHSSVHDNY